jgi:hypothetical protein
MKSFIRAEIALQRSILDRIEKLCNDLPENSLRPWMVTSQLAGELIFSGGFNNERISRIKSAFGDDGWKKVHRKYSNAIDSVKTLDCLVVVRIENIEHIPDESPVEIQIT